MKARIAKPGEELPEGYSRVVVGAVKERMNFRVLDTSRSGNGTDVWITFSDEAADELLKEVNATKDLIEKTLFVKFPDGVDPLPEM